MEVCRATDGPSVRVDDHSHQVVEQQRQRAAVRGAVATEVVATELARAAHPVGSELLDVPRRHQQAPPARQLDSPPGGRPSLGNHVRCEHCGQLLHLVSRLRDNVVGGVHRHRQILQGAHSFHEPRPIRAGGDRLVLGEPAVVLVVVVALPVDTGDVRSLFAHTCTVNPGRTPARGHPPAAPDNLGAVTFNPQHWRPVPGFENLTDITYHRHVSEGIVRVAFDRPEVRNAFRPHTVDELYQALDHARMTSDVGAVLLTGNGPSPKDQGWAFCSGGDQRIRGRSGYQYAEGETADTVDRARAGRLHILEVQRLIRFMPKVVICLVNGWAAGGGHSLHVVCDLTLASREHARFKQTDADVGSFDGGYGSAYLAKMVGQKFAREIFFLGETYTAEEMHRMGAVNKVVDHAELEDVGIEWGARINGKSPQAQRMLKYAFNLQDDGLVGQQLFAGEATRMAYMTDEAVEGRDSFLEKREPDWKPYPWYF
jgi:naphthoate synthase